MNIFKKINLVKCEECMCLLMKKDATVVEERERVRYFNPYGPNPHTIVTHHFFCLAHSKKFDVVESELGSKPVCYKRIPARMQKVDAKGKFI